MPATTILPLGATVSIDHTPGDHTRAKRSEVQGWTHRAARGNRDFLWSVIPEALTGDGYALTLTVRHCPETHDDWHRLRKAYFERLRRFGIVRGHWVTEWQRRGVPHMHCAIWLAKGQDPAPLIEHWLEVSAPYEASIKSQAIKPIHGVPGWFEYMAKHASRSVKNYQRAPESIPDGWKKTGRMWGHVGDWPRVDADKVYMDWGMYYAYRRALLRYAAAKARKQGDWRAVNHLRSYLSHPERSVSHSRGVGLWVPIKVQYGLLQSVRAE